MSEAKTYTTEELQIYTTIVLRYYNYYLDAVFNYVKHKETDAFKATINDETIKEFSDWYSKFIYDGDMRTTVKQHNQTKHEN